MFAIVVLDMVSLIAMRLRTWAWELRAKLDAPAAGFTSEIISTMIRMAMTTTASTASACPVRVRRMERCAPQQQVTWIALSSRRIDGNIFLHPF
jgi:hypothetical protein